MKKIFIAAAVIISSTVHAQDTTQLEQVVLTANKIEQKQNETGKVLTVIGRKELEKNLGRSIGELLNEQVGIIIGGANNNPGTNQTVYVRGADAANTLILMDGVPLNDPSGVTSQFDLNTFSIDQIERIEILKGAQSTLYGSDAVAGVINIISRKPTKGMQVDGQLSAGSFGSVRSALGIKGINDCGLIYQAGYSLFSSEGISAAHDTTGIAGYDKDAFEQHIMQASIGYNKIKNTELLVYGKYNINRAGIDAGAYQDDKDYNYTSKNSIAGLHATYHQGKSNLNLLYNFNRYNRSYLDDSTDVAGTPYKEAFDYSFIYQKGMYYGQSHFAELYENYAINSKLNLVGGVDYRQNKTSQTYTYAIKSLGLFSSLPLDSDTASTKQYSGYGSLLYHDEKLSAGLGLRYNHHSVYGDVVTWSVNPAYTFHHTKVFANASSGYRVPSLYQLFSEFGNKDLKPERSVNYELGVEVGNEMVYARGVGFMRNIKDVFSFYTDYTTYASHYINEDKQKDKGLELEISIKPVKALMVSANYTYTTGTLDTKTTDGKDTSYSNLYRRPQNIFNIKVGYQATKAWYISAHARGVSSFFEPRYAMEPLNVDGYTVIDLYSEYKFGNMFRLFVDLKNLGNKEYFDQPGFNTKPFSLHGGITFSIDSH